MSLSRHLSSAGVASSCPSSRADARRDPRETIVEFEGDPVLNGVDAICTFAGWSRRDLAQRLGVGEPVLRYYGRGGDPPWLGHALVGIAVLELGLTVDHARELLAHPAASPAHAISDAR